MKRKHIEKIILNDSPLAEEDIAPYATQFNFAVLYNKWRSALANLFHLRRHIMVDKDVLDDIFLMERRTLITLMLLETILLYILVPILGNGVFAWYGMVLILTMWRYYNAYQYATYPKLNTPLLWHQKFVIQVWLTALLFSLLGLFAIPVLPPYYQLFVFIVVMGISTGVVKTLGEDQRTAIGYLLILLVPLIVEMLLLGRQEMLILAFLTIIYLVSQVNLLLQSYERFVVLKKARKVIEEAQKQLYEKQEILQNFFDQASEGIFTYDSDLKILDCNQAFLNFFHLSKEAIIGEKFTELEDQTLVTILQLAKEDGTADFKGPYRDRYGIKHWIEVRCSAIVNQRGATIGGVGLIQDKTREQVATEELEFLVSHDPLTSTCNRRGFHQYIQQLLRKEEHKRLPTLLFYLDMNRFKQVNDLYGHEAGDQLLIQGSRRLRELLPENACLTRMGGDEFSIVIPFVPMEKSKEEKVIVEWVERLIKVLSEPYTVQEQSISVDWSIGVVVIEPGALEIDELIRKADISMMQAKADPELRYVRYTADMGERHRRINRLHQDIRKALEEEQFLLYFQPIVRAGDDSLVAAEVLLRWNHPEKGMLLPGEFLAVARQFHHIAEIDFWVLERVCRQIAEWKALGDLPFRSLAVNIDAHLLLRESFPEVFSELLRKYGIRSGELTLEITEDSLVDNFDQALKVLQWLREQGIGCAIDDFGTGYSSLSYLKKLSFDTLKIDREFVRDMQERIENIFLLQTIIDMGKKLNYSIVVEGIETQRQRQIIAGIDPEIACQGYLISRPIPEEEFRRDFLEREG